MIKKIWLMTFTGLFAAILVAFIKSPFVHSQSPFARFERETAIPAGLIGLLGTLVILIWGWLLLRKQGKSEDKAKPED